MKPGRLILLRVVAVLAVLDLALFLALFGTALAAIWTDDAALSGDLWSTMIWCMFALIATGGATGFAVLGASNLE